ncbi:hypothetical protein [Paenibacillus sp. sgz500958]|uniref:hypothetical protein n=1 Tax=Paenibacillus sp. sgz500958 TaxID=3242475 RepID=UPI0036D41A30
MSNFDGGTPFTNPEGQNPGPQKAKDSWNSFIQDERVQQARQVSKQYFSFFLSALVRPYRTMRTVGEEQTLNGIITAALVSAFSAFYFLFWFLKWDISPAFGPGFLKPLFLTAFGIAVAFGLIFAVLRLEKVSFSLKLLLARFGTLLIPAVAVLVLANLFLLVSLYTFSLYLLVLAFLFIFAAINAVVFQYPIHDSAGSVDVIYSIILTNAVTGYIFYKLITSVVAGAIGGLIGSVSPFNF